MPVIFFFSTDSIAWTLNIKIYVISLLYIFLQNIFLTDARYNWHSSLSRYRNLINLILASQLLDSDTTSSMLARDRKTDAEMVLHLQDVDEGSHESGSRFMQQHCCNASAAGVQFFASWQITVRCESCQMFVLPDARFSSIIINTRGARPNFFVHLSITS